MHSCMSLTVTLFVVPRVLLSQSQGSHAFMQPHLTSIYGKQCWKMSLDCNATIAFSHH